MTQTKEKTQKARKFILVTPNNNNKFYNMLDMGDDTFLAEWGRVGAKTISKTYPISQWQSKSREKMNKGYKDITHIFSDSKEVEEYCDIDDHNISSLVKSLQQYSRQSIYDNYMITSENVTPAMIESAQSVIDQIMFLIEKRKYSAKDIDNLLIELYTIIPRRMTHVKEHLTSSMKNIKKELRNKIAQEQETLDVMRGEVSVNEKTRETSQSLLEAIGISVENVNNSEIKTIKKLMGKDKDYFRRAFKINHTKSQDRYTQQFSQSKKKKSQLLWHGSRNENWWSILESGLLLRPASAVITGKMFGYGIYFADAMKKSMGYTSSYGSYWAGGSSSTAYLALFDVHLGNPLKVKAHDDWMYDLTQNKLRRRGDYDSLFAKGGIDLINNEYIIYSESQCTIKYLIEIGV